MLIRATGNRDWRKFFFDLKVTVDGVEQSRCIEADDVAGYVVRYACDAAGKPTVNQDRYEVERIEGVVAFVGRRRFSEDDAKAAAEAKRARRRARNLTADGRGGSTPEVSA